MVLDEYSEYQEKGVWPLHTRSRGQFWSILLYAERDFGPFWFSDLQDDVQRSPERLRARENNLGPETPSLGKTEIDGAHQMRASTIIKIGGAHMMRTRTTIKKIRSWILQRPRMKSPRNEHKRTSTFKEFKPQRKCQHRKTPRYRSKIMQKFSQAGLHQNNKSMRSRRIRTPDGRPRRTQQNTATRCSVQRL